MLELLLLRHLTEGLFQHVGVSLEATTHQSTLICGAVVDSINALGGVLIPGCEDDYMRTFAHAVRVQCSSDHLLLELLVCYNDEAELL